jgi:hypothetical protein
MAGIVRKCPKEKEENDQAFSDYNKAISIATGERQS